MRSEGNRVGVSRPCGKEAAASLDVEGESLGERGGGGARRRFNGRGGGEVDGSYGAGPEKRSSGVGLVLVLIILELVFELGRGSEPGDSTRPPSDVLPHVDRRARRRRPDVGIVHRDDLVDSDAPSRGERVSSGLGLVGIPSFASKEGALSLRDVRAALHVDDSDVARPVSGIEAFEVGVRGEEGPHGVGVVVEGVEDALSRERPELDAGRGEDRWRVSE